ncbi:MAG: hypothetical protein IH610_09600 [Deltaproteobacteria bacterium]|nr:hypothetical protein [Deltaproteobacteria bacterium]
MRPFILLSLLAALAFAAGCSTANSPGGDSHIDASGNSVPGWVVVPTGGSHSGAATQEYISGSGNFSCTQCHGADLSGGITAASCFGNPAGCHHDPVPNWATPAVHGADAKKAPGSSGFASCQICHGNNFSGGGSQVSCFTCHRVSAPHAPKPWHGSTYTHTTTDTANAPVCAQCHYTGSPNNPAGHPATPAPAGTAPGCFNNTLCHGENPVPHPVGSAWVAASPAAQPHGNSAKAAPGAGAGYIYCQACHGTGTDFAGGSSGKSCYPCHGNVGTPHPAQWRIGDGYVHSSTAEGNASVCANCHRNGANSPIAPPSPPAAAGTAPGCFNSTLCHGPTFHSAGWGQATQHGPVAKQSAIAGTSGFAYCQVCHGTGTDFAGGIVGISCYICHGVSAPHPAGSTWRNDSTPTHRSTDPSNADVCAFCHRNANPGSPGCFNNTLCHGS